MRCCVRCTSFPALVISESISQGRRFSPFYHIGEPAPPPLRCAPFHLFPSSIRGFAVSKSARDIPLAQITTAFPSVSQVQSAFCPGVTGFHLLCCCMSRRRCSAVLFTQLATSIPEPGSKHDARTYHDGWYCKIRKATDSVTLAVINRSLRNTTCKSDSFGR